MHLEHDVQKPPSSKVLWVQGLSGPQFLSFILEYDDSIVEFGVLKTRSTLMRYGLMDFLCLSTISKLDPKMKNHEISSETHS